MVKRWLVVTLATISVACVEAETRSSYQIGDTTVVFSVESARDTATLREVLRIGEAEGAPEYMFAQISMFTVGPTGNVFVAQSDGDLREFDAEGRFVRTVARPGQGPGEVEYVVGMDVDRDGRLAVLDFSNQRVSIYSPDGQFERQMRRPAGRPGYGRDAIQWDDQGDLWLAIHPLRSGPDTLTNGPRPLYGKLVADGMVVDTIHLPARGWTGCERRRAGFAGGFFEDARLPYLPFAQWTFDPSGVLVFGCSADYSFDMEYSGRVIRVSRDWDAAVLTDEAQDYYELIQESETGIPRPRFSVPRERPAFLRIWRARDGRLWLWPGSPGSSQEVTEQQREAFSRFLPGRAVPPRLWNYWSPTDGLDVFDGEGRWIGHVATPPTWDGDPFPGLTDPFFRGDTVWAVTKDDFDLRYISKFVVEWPPSN